MAYTINVAAALRLTAPDLAKVRRESRPQKDLCDLPEEVRKEMEFIFAQRVEDVLQTAIPQLSERMNATKTRPIIHAA